MAERKPKILVSLKVDPDLWAAFQAKCDEMGLTYSKAVEFYAMSVVDSEKVFKMFDKIFDAGKKVTRMAKK